MKLITCFTLSCIHLLTLAVCTYIASVEIYSIFVSAWVCTTTGMAMFGFALVCKRPVLAATGCLPPIIAVSLFVLEAFFLHLGPRDAMFPFCVVFVIHHVIATLIILVNINILIAPAGTNRKQMTLRTLLVSMTSFSVFFAVAKQILPREFNGMMALALGLLGLTFVALTITIFTAIANRDKTAGDTSPAADAM